MLLHPSLADEAARRQAYPVCAQKIFLAHAAVTALPRVVADAMIAHTEASTLTGPEDYVEVLKQIRTTRESCARLIDANPEEIALLGPTSLGLSLFAGGLDWQPGDEVIYYAEDYPANVYPWTDLARRGVTARELRPARPGEITPELVEAALTPRTRLVALASAHFLTGYRIDVDGIGQMLGARGVLFSVDAIQTLGAFPLSVRHVDFLAADAHKWLLGPLSIGIVYVKKIHFERLRPVLLGAANVRSPDFISQPEIVFSNTAARYEPGVLNVGPMLGMKAAIDLFLEIGPDRVAERIGGLVGRLAAFLGELGFTCVAPVAGPNASGILTVDHPTAELAQLSRVLQENRITASLRHNRLGKGYLRFAPHFYNTEEELEQVAAVLRTAL